MSDKNIFLDICPSVPYRFTMQAVPTDPKKLMPSKVRRTDHILAARHHFEFLTLKRVKLATVCIYLFLVASASANPTNSTQNAIPSWVMAARRLIGESEDRRSIALEKIKNELKEPSTLYSFIGGPFHGYALDALVAWQDVNVVPDLLQMIEKDRDGSIVLTINALMPEKYRATVTDSYLRFLREEIRSLPTPTVMAIVDHLTLLKTPIPSGELYDLLDHDQFGVQQSAVLHIESLAQTKHKEAASRIKVLMEKFLKLAPQSQAQALFLFQEIDRGFARRMCKAESIHPILRSACRFNVVLNRRGRRAS